LSFLIAVLWLDMIRVKLPEERPWRQPCADTEEAELAEYVRRARRRRRSGDAADLGDQLRGLTWAAGSRIRQQAFDLRLSGASAAGFKPIIGQ